MFSVLIVDDEILVRVALKNMIEWEKMGMQVIAEAKNGKEAFEIYQNQSPDLILTDIKMPDMDGLAFICKIREVDKKTKIIILTCYEEFDLVHTALKLGVSDYILKLKMSMQDITEIIEKVREEMILENIKALQYGTDIAQQKCIEKTIMEYILCDNCSSQQLETAFLENAHIMGSKKLVLCVLYTKGNSQPPGVIFNLLCDLVSNYRRGIVIHEKEGYFILLFSFSDISSEWHIQKLLFEIIRQIESKLKIYFNLKAVFGISTVGERCDELKRLYKEAYTALEYHYFAGDMNCIQYLDNGFDAQYNEDLDRLESYVKEYEHNDTNYYNEILNEIDHLRDMFGKKHDELQDVIIRLIHWPTIMSEIKIPDNATKLAFPYVQSVRKAQTFTEVIDTFIQFLAELEKQRANMCAVSREIMEAADFIRKNYTRSNISLQQIADHVEMSANYVSKLFKEQMGISYIEYLNRLRINKAKQLLANTHMKSYEVSHNVGFLDESYFTRVFKRYTGLKPTEYKKSGMMDNNGDVSQ